MFHYVYRITNTVLNKHYYGVRTSKIDPKLDLGFKYFSSSSDKEFIQIQKENPQDYKYKIIKIFNSRVEAAELEIFLHKKFNVVVNESFYNKANSTSSGWDTTGTILSNEHREKLSMAKIGTSRTNETKLKISNSTKGIPKPPFSHEHREKLSMAKKGKPSNQLGISRTNETKLKMSNAQKGVPKEQVECPYCGKIGGKPIMGRYHFENCKLKENDE
jgi:hypothetical protein